MRHGEAEGAPLQTGETQAGHAARRPAAGAEIPASSLCCNCMYAQSCTHRRRSGQPVTHCEEHAVDAAQPLNERPASACEPPVASEAEDSARELLGLCSNCEQRQTCRLPKPEGGIWHCEEYS